MTYALGWKTENEVFLAADAAITTIGCKNLEFLKTSFGKENIIGSGNAIEERAVKLYLKNNIGATYAGPCSIATNILKNFYDEIEAGKSPEEALRWSLNLNNANDNLSRVGIIIAYHDGNNPRLLTFNSQDDQSIRVDEQLAQIGSIPSKYKEMTDKALQQVVPVAYNDPKRLLSTMLATLQSHAVFDDLMPHGVGGTFSGLYVGKDRGYWQPDILYVVHKGVLVSTCFRSESLVVNSPILGESKCFIGVLPWGETNVITEELIEQANEAVEQAKKMHHQEAAFDYVVVFGDPSDSREGKKIVMIEMLGNRKHELLWLEPFEKDGRTGTKVASFPGLLKALKAETFFTYARYSRPLIEEIPKDKIREFSIDLEGTK